MLILLVNLSLQQNQQLCKDHLPTLSVQDINLNSKNWDQFKKENDIYILGVSDSKCKTCCQSEPLLEQLQAIFNTTMYNKKQIKIARIDLSKKHAFLERDQLYFENVPKVLIIKDQQFFWYDQPINRVDLILNQINKILNPVIDLKTEEDIEEFLLQDQPWLRDEQTKFYKTFISQIDNQFNDYYQNLRYKTRVIMFVYDKQEYKEELKTLKQVSKYLATRENLRIGAVVDQKLIKRLKIKQPLRFFPQVGMTSMVLKRYDNELLKYDVTSEETIYFNSWINKNTLKRVDILNSESFKIYELLRQPMFITFVDFEDGRYSKKCYEAVEVLNQVAEKFHHLIGFFYVNNTVYYNRKRVLGITWEELPAMAFNMIDQRVLPYPRGKKISKDTLFTWFDDVFLGKIQGKTSNFQKVINDTLIQNLLNNTMSTGRNNYNSIVLQEGFDAISLLYTTEVINDVQRNIAFQFNLVCDSLIRLKFIDNIKCVSYDINANSYPEGIEFSYDLPAIYFYPAYHKLPPFKKFSGKGFAGAILQYIEQMADIKIKYPVDISQVGLPKNQTQNATVEENNQEKKDKENIDEVKEKLEVGEEQQELKEEF